MFDAAADQFNWEQKDLLHSNGGTSSKMQGVLTVAKAENREPSREEMMARSQSVPS